MYGAKSQCELTFSTDSWQVGGGCSVWCLIWAIHFSKVATLLATFHHYLHLYFGETSARKPKWTGIESAAGGKTAHDALSCSFCWRFYSPCSIVDCPPYRETAREGLHDKNLVIKNLS